jgi:hypothetical protein
LKILIFKFLVSSGALQNTSDEKIGKKSPEYSSKKPVIDLSRTTQINLSNMEEGNFDRGEEVIGSQKNNYAQQRKIPADEAIIIKNPKHIRKSSSPSPYLIPENIVVKVEEIFLGPGCDRQSEINNDNNNNKKYTSKLEVNTKKVIASSPIRDPYIKRDSKEAIKEQIGSSKDNDKSSSNNISLLETSHMSENKPRYLNIFLWLNK